MKNEHFRTYLDVIDEETPKMKIDFLVCNFVKTSKPKTKEGYGNRQ